MRYKVEKGSAKGTIVFVHGNSSSSIVFDEVLKSKLISQTKIAVDLPGHGNNAEAEDEVAKFSIENYRAKLIELINTIDDDILLVGNSLGGHLAIEIAEDIERLKGLIIFGTPPLKKPLNLEQAFLQVEPLQTFFTEYPTDIEIEPAIHQVSYAKECVPKLITDFKQANPKVRKAIMTDIAEDKFLDQYAVFTHLKPPKFIIAGKQDPSVNPEYLETVKDNCGESCELIKFDGCGHYPSIEKPEEFIKTLQTIVLRIFK
ncbi:alpha/beta hydrolase [Algibacter sp. 2305UL17-15]|uniref:alpha/beta fold hydrolase n=1 Tax=Algibacter sp. 2305UL17-15 TaxID=3231268 RepID=UPI003458D3DD